MSFEYEVVKAAGTDAPALNTASPTKIKVVGCGGCGGNAVNTMIESGVGGVEFIAMNTDLQALSQNKAQYKIQIGQKLAGGLGAGGKPEVGEESAKEQQEQIKELLKDSDMVFITAGMGGGTGTGSAPVVAKIARDLGALTVAVVTTPFKFEGKVRMAHAEEGVRKLREEVDSLIAIPNELILKDAEKRLSVPMAFTLINDILRQGVQGISDIITKPGLVNRDFRNVEMQSLESVSVRVIIVQSMPLTTQSIIVFSLTQILTVQKMFSSISAEIMMLVSLNVTKLLRLSRSVQIQMPLFFGDRFSMSQWKTKSA